MNSHDKNVAKAEVKTVNFLVQHSLPLGTVDHLGPLFKYIFPDSKIVSSYACGRTKTSAILNEILALSCKKYLEEHCKSHPFTLGTNGSSVKRGKTITIHCFDMCLTAGNDCGAAKTLFKAIENKFDKSSLPWNNGVRLSLDSNSTMIGEHNSIASNTSKKNQNVFIGVPVT